MLKSIVRFASKKAAPIEKLDPLPYFTIQEPNDKLPKISGMSHLDLNDRLQLLAALDLEHRQRADPTGIKSSLIDSKSSNALKIGDLVSVETIRSRSYPRSSIVSGICKSINRNGYASSIGVETVIMGTSVNIRYKVYSPLVTKISLVKREEKTEKGK